MRMFKINVTQRNVNDEFFYLFLNLFCFVRWTEKIYGHVWNQMPYQFCKNSYFEVLYRLVKR